MAKKGRKGHDPSDYHTNNNPNVSSSPKTENVPPPPLYTGCEHWVKPPQGHQQWPKTPPDGRHNLTKTPLVGRENCQQTPVDKDAYTKSVTDAPTPRSVFQKEVAKNELRNPQVDQEKSSCFAGHESKDSCPKQLRTRFEQHLTTVSDEEGVNNQLRDRISEEQNSEEDISDQPCDYDNNKFDTYEINVIRFGILLVQNIKDKIY